MSKPAAGLLLVHMPPGYEVPPGDKGGGAKSFFSRMFVDDAVFMETQCSLSRDRLLRASELMGSDDHRLLCERRAGGPPLLAPVKVFPWHTRLEVLASFLIPVAMAISLPQTRSD